MTGGKTKRVVIPPHVGPAPDDPEDVFGGVVVEAYEAEVAVDPGGRPRKRRPSAQDARELVRRWEAGEFEGFKELESHIMNEWGVGRTTAQSIRAELGI